MLLGGLQKFSLLDYPGRISAIVFTKGCNFRCHFCYNPMLVWPTGDGKSKYGSLEQSELIKDHPFIKEDDFLTFLKSRKDKLNAVVVTGGEPTIHKDLPQFLKKIKDLGYLVKLDTNGTDPEMLKKTIDQKLVDYIAMDLKASALKYESVTNVKVDLAKIKKSIKIIMESGLLYEFRTTVVPELIEKEDIEEMAKVIEGAQKWYLQQFKPDSDLVDNQFEKIKPYSERILKEMCNIARKYVKQCEVR